jgi:hypothetical protein
MIKSSRVRFLPAAFPFFLHVGLAQKRFNIARHLRGRITCRFGVGSVTGCGGSNVGSPGGSCIGLLGGSRSGGEIGSWSGCLGVPELDDMRIVSTLELDARSRVLTALGLPISSGDLRQSLELAQAILAGLLFCQKVVRRCLDRCSALPDFPPEPACVNCAGASV